MLNTKFDLYNAEWLDVVFDDRNKAYGAYDLRSHYAGTLNKAMAIAFSVVITGAVVLSFAFKTEPMMNDKGGVIVELPPLPPPPVKHDVKKPDAPKALPPSKPSAPATTKQFVTPTITKDPVTTDPPKNIEMTGEVGAKTETGTGPGVIPADQPATGSGGDAVKAEDNEIKNTLGLEVQPEPYGGMAAFGKFLGKALRFPPQAMDAGVSGRVIMSFVIEKNGEISNIHVDRVAGYGFDEEATRVLKLAKAWKPGIQNGQPVRVRYMIPINFQLPQE